MDSTRNQRCEKKPAIAKFLGQQQLFFLITELWQLKKATRKNLKSLFFRNHRDFRDWESIYYILLKPLPKTSKSHIYLFMFCQLRVCKDLKFQVSSVSKVIHSIGAKFNMTILKIVSWLHRKKTVWATWTHERYNHAMKMRFYAWKYPWKKIPEETGSYLPPNRRQNIPPRWNLVQ